jgi:hypothetical protein
VYCRALGVISLVNGFQFSNVGAVYVTCNLHCQRTEMCVKVSSPMQLAISEMTSVAWHVFFYVVSYKFYQD